MSFEAAAWAIKQRTKLPTEKLVLIALSDCHNKDTARCDPSLLTLADVALCSDRTAIRAIESLVKQGFISTIKTLGKRTKYTLLMDRNPCQIVTPDKLSPVSQCHHTPDTHDRGPLTPMSPEPVSNSNKPVIKSVNKFTDTDYSFSEWFYEKVLMVAPHTKKPNLKAWANQVRLMREVDKISYQDMSDVFVWANQHEFWNTNILCISTFRTKFAKLHADSKKKPPVNQYNNQQNQQSARATRSLADAFK